MRVDIVEKVSRSGVRYVVEHDGHQVHMLSPESLSWHLGHIMGLDAEQVSKVFYELNTAGMATLELVAS